MAAGSCAPRLALVSTHALCAPRPRPTGRPVSARCAATASSSSRLLHPQSRGRASGESWRVGVYSTPTTLWRLVPSRLHLEDVRVAVRAHKRPPPAVQQQPAAADRRQRRGVARARRVRSILAEQQAPLPASGVVERERPHVCARHEPLAARLCAAANHDAAPARQWRSARAGARTGPLSGSCRERTPLPRARVQGEGIVDHLPVLGRPAKHDKRVPVGGGGDVQPAAARRRAAGRLLLERLARRIPH
mmetsp:Transcript_6536/g.20912  ORF Transcript_6536/g.20912 Transcript_6536/m.20912 type:complete len:248 (+) Transcript_6536:89-832(+)